MSTATPDTPITVVKDADGTFVLTADDGSVSRHPGITALWSAIDRLDDPVAYHHEAAAA